MKEPSAGAPYPEDVAAALNIPAEDVREILTDEQTEQVLSLLRDAEIGLKQLVCDRPGSKRLDLALLNTQGAQRLIENEARENIS